MFIDLHCHSTLRAFNGGKQLWYYDPPKDRQRDNFLTRYTQSAFSSLARGGVHVAFVSLYPVEQGFMSGLANHLIQPEGGLALFANKLISDIIENTDTIRKLGTKYVLNLTAKRFYAIDQYEHEYFDDIDNEYRFLAAPDNATGTINANGEKSYSIKIVKDFSELSDVLGLDENFNRAAPPRNILAVIVTIEGGHALGCGQKNTAHINPDDASHPDTRTLLDKISKNIIRMKHWGGGDHAPFFITFTHHFWNQLCGHSMSFAKVMHEVFDQRTGMGQGMTWLGKEVIKMLLSRENGRRILIDTKHLSLEGKKWYYGFIEDHNNNDPNDKIPIIASHTAVNGFKTMVESANSPDHREGDEKYEASTVFNNWDINIADEEIKRIHDSGGLIGIIMDERVLTGNAYLNSIQNLTGARQFDEYREIARSVWSDAVLRNMIHIAEVITASGVPHEKVWSSICIGSDFDGMINPVDAFCYSEDFQELRNMLIRKINDSIHTIEVLRNVDAVRLVDDMMYKNALRFLKQHFKAHQPAPVPEV